MLWFVPFFRSPFDVFLGGPSQDVKQMKGICSEMQVQAVLCLENYGLLRGRKECADLMDDFVQCQYQVLQRQRIKALYYERQNQIDSGKLTKENAFPEKPPFHTMSFN